MSNKQERYSRYCVLLWRRKENAPRQYSKRKKTGVLPKTLIPHADSPHPMKVAINIQGGGHVKLLRSLKCKRDRRHVMLGVYVERR
jgi:hypothetical protein